MTTFFEKLKKGMDVEEKPASKEKIVPKKRTVKKEIEIKNEPARQSPAFSQKWRDLGGPEGQLTIDVYQTDGEIVIQSAIAGIEPEDLDISVEKDVVAIRGKREKQVEEKGQNYFYQECYWGRFSREIILPAEVDSSKAKAVIKNGILTIRIPKAKKIKTKKLVIEE